MSWKHATLTASLVQDPTLSESKISTNRWTYFVVDMEDERQRFVESIRRVSDVQSQVNDEFKKCSKMSFNAMHNVIRHKPAESQIPIIRKRKRTDEMTFMTASGFQDTSTNYKQWPARSSAAKRLLAPQTLAAVYRVKPKGRDTHVVSGERLAAPDAL